MKTQIKVFVTLIILISSAMPMTGCSPSITREETEKELVSFMLDFIAQIPNDDPANYVQTTGQPWLNPPLKANLIIYSPPNKKVNKDPWELLRTDDPIKVWWYFDNKLVEATDSQMAIQMWEEHYMFNAELNSWPDRYEFGILSISINKKKATIYFSSSSCPECAGGLIHTVEKNDSGKWEITDSELLWLS